MFRGQKRFDEIREKLNTAIEEIFVEYQEHYEMSGDIEPLYSLALDEKEDEIAEIIQAVLQYEFDFTRG